MPRSTRRGFRANLRRGCRFARTHRHRNSRCLVLIGSHLGENMHNTQVQEFADRDRAGVPDHRGGPSLLSRRQQGETLPSHQTGDRPRAAAGMDDDRDRAALRPRLRREARLRLRALRAEIAARTPEWAYPETGIDPETIRETAREMARHRPATLVHPGRRTNWYGDDAQRGRAIALLNALLGSWGRKGGFYYPSSMDVPNYPYPPYPTSARGKADNPGHRFPFASEAITTGIRETTLAGQPYPVKGWIVYATNLIHALPNQRETIRAIQALDLLVVVDVIPSEIAGWADVVLPESTYLERYDDLNVEWFREPFVALRQPVVRRPTTRSPTGGSPASSPSSSGSVRTTRGRHRGVPRAPAHGRGPQPRRAQGAGLIRGPPVPVYFEEGVPPSSPRPREDRVLLDAARGRGLRSGADATRAGIRRRVRSACCSAARRCTRSAAPSRTRSCTTGWTRTRCG